jgi:hypothetical protein
MAKKKRSPVSDHQSAFDLPAQPGALAKCDRCSVQLRIAESRRQDSRPFRKSATIHGHCPDCVMTEFLYNTYPVNMLIDERGPEMLLNAEFMRMALLSSGVMDPAHCEMDVNEINWQRVVDNWDLPVKVAKSGLNPYRMGDAKKEGRFGNRFGFFSEENQAERDAAAKKSVADLLTKLHPDDPVSPDDIDTGNGVRGPIYVNRKPQ